MSAKKAGMALDSKALVTSDGEVDDMPGGLGVLDEHVQISRRPQVLRTSSRRARVDSSVGVV